MMVVDSTKSWPMPAPAHTAPKSTPEQPGCAAPELQLLVLQPSLSVCSNHDGLRAPDHHRPAHGGNPAGLQRQPSAGCVCAARWSAAAACFVSTGPDLRCAACSVAHWLAGLCSRACGFGGVVLPSWVYRIPHDLRCEWPTCSAG